MTGIWNYLKEGILPEDKDEARRMRVRSAKFVIVRDELFKRGISAPLLKCLTAPQAAYVIKEIHLLVAIDYFTRWIEACPLAKIPSETGKKFTWKSIICKFGIRHSLITDNDRQFIAQSFEDFLRELGIKHLLTSVEHPQTNGQATKIQSKRIKKVLLGVIDQTQSAFLGGRNILHNVMAANEVLNEAKRKKKKPMISKFKKKLSSWKNKVISMARRVCLINLVLATLPLYFISFFKIPSNVVRKIIIIQRNFLWGLMRGRRKILWIN
uniref:Pro-Pol polyprotein n=1 Tax=Cajanus cajan TaxID=3821 RepID=A0A151RJ63_CAJCA|nr:Pro-Pol polyprotein [Cajanus cajan]